MMQDSQMDILNDNLVKKLKSAMCQRCGSQGQNSDLKYWDKMSPWSLMTGVKISLRVLNLSNRVYEQSQEVTA